jgi:TRAP-type C4-dicarboxylate transport system substrate-binding protein
MRRFMTLPADVRKILEDTARETQAFVYAQAAKDDEDLRAKFASSGMKINEVNKDAFIAASKTIYEEFGQEVPGSAALIQQAIALGK